MSARGKRLVFRALLYLGGFLAALVLAEVVVRVRVPGKVNPYEPFYVHDDFGTRRPKPGFRSEDGKVSIDSLGFRDSDEFPERKPDGETRLLFLGDSFLYAARLGEGEILPKRCEALLQPKRAGRVRAINSGCPAYGPNHEREVLEHHGLALSPSVVVLCFFVGNDVTDVLTTEGVTADASHALRLEKHEEKPFKRLLMCSKLFQLVEATAFYQRLAHKRFDETARSRSGFVPLVQELYETVEATRLEQWRKGAWERPPLDLGWRRVDEELAAIFALARRSGAAPIVLVIPDEVQVDARLRARICERFSLDEREYDLEQPQRKVRELCLAAKVPCVDALEAFRKEGGQGGLYLELDTHWNARGHELAASLLLPELEALLARGP